MRDVALGHWNYLTWHVPATLLTLVGIALAIAMGRSLRRNEFNAHGRALRWRILGWSALMASLGSAIAWPYLTAAARVHVDAQGTWHVSNYLGVPLATVDAMQRREVRGVDLGGVGMGTGHVEIRTGDGRVLRSVRIDRDTLDGLRHALGYTGEWVSDVYGDQVIVAHTYSGDGPVR